MRVKRPRIPLESLTPLPVFEVPVIALLPDTFIKMGTTALLLSAKMMVGAIHTLSLVLKFRRSEDRYGRSPHTVSFLFAISWLGLRLTVWVSKLTRETRKDRLYLQNSADHPPRLFTMIPRVQLRTCYI